MAEPAETDDIQAKVLQTTLAKISPSRQSEGDEPSIDCCVICLDAISEPSTALPCAHGNFDFLCLLSWLQERATCPLCKANVYKVRYRDAKAGESIYRVPNAIKARNSEAGQNSELLVAESLTRRRRRRRSPDAVRNADRLLSRPGEAVDRRRQVYRHQLYSLHVGSNLVSQYKTPPMPKDFATTPHLVSRARLWLRRELQVFAFLSEPAPDSDNGNTQQRNSRQQAETESRRRDNAEFLLEYIIAIVKTVDLQGSAGQAEDMLSDFLGRDNARLFLHELRNWLRSPCQSLAVWDREVQYPDEQHKRRTDAEESHNQQRRQRSDGMEGFWTWQDPRGGDHWRASRPNRKRRYLESGDDESGRPRSRIRDG